MTFLNRKRLRDARYLRGQCVHCAGRRLATSSRCGGCPDKVRRYYAQTRAAAKTRAGREARRP